MSVVSLVLGAWFATTVIAVGVMFAFERFLYRRNARQIAQRRLQRGGYLAVVPTNKNGATR